MSFSEAGPMKIIEKGRHGIMKVLECLALLFLLKDFRRVQWQAQARCPASVGVHRLSDRPDP
jgi:hypothetical protein